MQNSPRSTALKIGLPWVTAEYDATREVMGDDFWSYGVAANRKTLGPWRDIPTSRASPSDWSAVEEMFASGNAERDQGLGRTIMTVQLICCSHSPLMTTDVEESEPNVHAEFFRELDSCAAALQTSIPISWWCSGPITSTASSTS